MRRILAALLFITSTLCAEEEWIKLTTPHFELYTTAGEKKGREAILYFEQVRTFFMQASPSKKAPEFPVRIIAFRSEKEYKPYRINDFAAAFYTRNDRRDYIVMENIAAERYPVAIHEYCHLIVEHSGLKLPVWLNEGWAEVYSTLKPLGKKAQIGNIIPGRAQELMAGKWIDLSTLTSVDASSPFYNEKAKAGMFYSESWALAHMLTMSLEYREQFTPFVAALASGKNASESFQSAFHKSITEVQNDLRQYLTRNTLYGAVFNLKLDKSAEDPEVVAPPVLERELALADLLAQTGKREQARSAYERLAASNPGRPEIEESLGYLSWRADDKPTAIQHFRRAVAGGSKNPQLCYQLAMLQREAGETEAQAIPTLRKAVELKPDYVEARLQLGYMELNTKDYAGALRTLGSIKRVNPDQAPHLFRALAYAQLNLGNEKEARTSAELARKWSTQPEQAQQADSLLRYLEERQKVTGQPPAISSDTANAGGAEQVLASSLSPNGSAPTPDLHVQTGEVIRRVQGTIEQLDCSGKVATLRIIAGSTRLALLITEPDKIVLNHGKAAPFEFSCGAQKRLAALVEYAEQPDTKSGTAGVVRAIDF